MTGRNFCSLCGRPMYRGTEHVCPMLTMPSSTIPSGQLRVPKLDVPEVKLVSIEHRGDTYTVQEQFSRELHHFRNFDEAIGQVRRMFGHHEGGNS